MKSAFWQQTPTISKSSLKRKQTSLVLTTNKRAKEAQLVHDDPLGYHEAIVRSLEPHTQSSYLLHTAWDLHAYIEAQESADRNNKTVFGQLPTLARGQVPKQHHEPKDKKNLNELAFEYFRGVERSYIPETEHKAAHVAPPPLLPSSSRPISTICLNPECGWDLDDYVHSSNSNDSCPQCGELVGGTKKYVFNFQDSQHRTTRTSPPYLRIHQFILGINDLQGRHKRPLPPKHELDRILEQLKQIEAARRQELAQEIKQGRQTPSLRSRLLRTHQIVGTSSAHSGIDITVHDVKAVLGKMGLLKHVPFIATIMNRYNGTPLPVLPPEYVQALDFLLPQINSVYDEAKASVADGDVGSQERKSFFSQFYLQFKLLTAIGAPAHWLDRIKLLRNPLIVGQQEKIYQKCCELLDWNFQKVPDILLKQN